MKILTNNNSNNIKSEFGNFELIPDEGWEISQVFIDFESKLLVAIISIIDRNKWVSDGFCANFIPTKQYIIDKNSLKILNFNEWKKYFSYDPIEIVSIDSKFKLTILRTHDLESNNDIIKEDLIEIISGNIVSTSVSQAFRKEKKENLLELIEIKKIEEEQRKRELDNKLTLDEFFEKEILLLTNGDLIINFNNSVNAFQLRFLDGYYNLDVSEQLPEDYKMWNNIKYLSNNRFKNLNDFWSFITQDEKWFNKYTPFTTSNNEMKSNILSIFVIKSINIIRLSQNFTYEDYEHIHEWENFIRTDEIKPSEYEQVCSNCKKNVNYFPRYPKYICDECRDKITDRNGRKLNFYNLGFMGTGCQGFYIDIEPNEKYNSNICYINEAEFFAEEARFGGIVIQKKRENDINGL